MKKFFALAILLSASLTEQCFAAELEDDLEKNFYVGANIIILDEAYYSDKIAIDNFRGSIIGGYNYTENVRAELEIIFVSPFYVPKYSGAFLANLCYYHKIKTITMTPYFGIGVGIINYWKNDDVEYSEAFLVQQIKIGVKYNVTPETSVSGGYSFIVHTTDDKGVYTGGIRSGATSYGLELGMSYNF